MKKVCFVTDNISHIGGVQRILATVTSELSKNENLEISILFCSPKPISKELVYELDEKIKIYYIDDYGKLNLSSFTRKMMDRVNRWLYPIKSVSLLNEIYFPKKHIQIFNNFFKDIEFDTLIGVTPKYAGLISLLDKTDVVKIGWLHSTYDRYFNLRRLEYWNQELLYEKLFQKLDNIVVLTDSAKRIFDTKMNLEVTRIYNPLTVKNNNSKYSLTNENLLYVGRIYDATKGTDLLIDIMKKVVEKVPSAKLVIVGDGPDRDAMILKIKNLDLENNVFWKGETDNVQRYFENSSVLLFPSKMEGFGLVITEAMSYGLPIVSFSTEGPSEIIQNDINGFLIPNYEIDIFANKVVTLIKEKNTRKKISKSAISRSKDFNIDNIMNQWNDVLERGKK